MEDLTLNEEIVNDISDFLITSKYSYNTWANYTETIKRIAKKYGKINQKIAMEWLRGHKNSNQLAILSLINNYCMFKDIDFFIKKIKVRREPRKYPDVLSFDEVKKFIENIPKEHAMIFRCIFNIGAGLRISDAVKLHGFDKGREIMKGLLNG